MIMYVLSWIVFGFIVGLIARFLYPGRQAMGVLGTMALGIVGSLVGGLISWSLGFAEEGANPFAGGGWIMSIAGALIVVWAGMAAFGRPTSGHVTG